MKQIHVRVFRGDDQLVAKSFSEFPVTIGRHSERHVHLSDNRVSRLHAEICYDGTVVTLAVRSDSSPTVLDGKTITGSVPLPERAELEIAGVFRLTIRTSDDDWRAVLGGQGKRSGSGSDLAPVEAPPPPLPTAPPRPLPSPASAEQAPRSELPPPPETLASQRGLLLPRRPPGQRPVPGQRPPAARGPAPGRPPAAGPPAAAPQVAVPKGLLEARPPGAPAGPAFVLVPVSDVQAAFGGALPASYEWPTLSRKEDEAGAERLLVVGERRSSPAGERLDGLLLMARGCDASDLHLVVDQPPVVRVNGLLYPAEEGRLTPGELQALLEGALAPEQLREFNLTGDLDWCHRIGEQRYRANACKDRAGPALTFRLIREHVPTLAELGLPPEVARLTTYAQGLVLVTGPLGAGKTTTLAALVDLVNRSRPDHIITCEDPIEFLIPPVKSQVSQRALAEHTLSFAAALRGALREDPDVLMIGDLRDYETATLAISAAETGHLVLASMAAMSAVKTLDKLIDLFPADEQSATRGMVSESLRGVICQRLVPGKAGRREVAVELLFNSVAVGNIIRDGSSSKLFNAIQLGRNQGMRTLEDSLRALLEQGRITPQTLDAELAR